jgi:carbonic anhydrase
VEEQCLNVIKTAVVQRGYINSGYPIVHGWVFDVRTGELIDLKINFTDKLKGIQEIYNLGIQEENS